jgi:hypothetical protein
VQANHSIIPHRSRLLYLVKEACVPRLSVFFFVAASFYGSHAEPLGLHLNASGLSALQGAERIAQKSSASQGPPLSAVVTSGGGGAQAPSVALSWTASKPVSADPKDAITGYNICRSTSKQAVQANKVTCDFGNAGPTATTCIDRNVQPGLTYYYAATAVAGRGKDQKESGCSKPPVKIKIPKP